MARNIASPFPFTRSNFPSRTACNYQIPTPIIFPVQLNIKLTNASAVNNIKIYIYGITKWKEIIFISSVWGGRKGNNKVDKEFGSLSAERRSKSSELGNTCWRWRCCRFISAPPALNVVEFYWSERRRRWLGMFDALVWCEQRFPRPV